MESRSDWRLEFLQDGHSIKYASCTFRISFFHLNTPVAACRVVVKSLTGLSSEVDQRDRQGTRREQVFISISETAQAEPLGQTKLSIHLKGKHKILGAHFCDSLEIFE